MLSHTPSNFSHFLINQILKQAALLGTLTHEGSTDPGLRATQFKPTTCVNFPSLLSYLSNLVQDRMPFIGPQKGALLQQIIRERQPCQIVEVGSMAGYSALTMAQALGPGGQVISLESDWKWALAAKRFVWQATQGDKSSKPVRLPQSLHTSSSYAC